jgi:peptidoglycan L-alanyl-D-glutamate endopeptidase CwlK
MASRDIKDLSGDMQIMYNKFFDRCRRDTELLRLGVSVLLTCTFRSGEEQDKLYAQGRTLPGAIVTRAKAGQSAHNVATPQGLPAAEAFDVVPLLHGKPVWTTKDDPNTPEPEDKIWEIIGAHGKAVGLKWYGDTDASFREFPHFQNPAWRK